VSFFSELKRRNVIRVSGVYAIVSWLLLQVAGALESGMLLPDWFDRLVLAVLLIGFPLAAIFAWAFELTPEGIKRTADVDPEASITAQTGSRLDMLLVVALIFFGGSILLQRFLPGADDESKAPRVADSARSGGAADASIAVLPFVDLSPEGDQEYFADGISEEILNVLAQIPELRVAARTSSFLFKEDQRSIAEVAGLLSVRHVLEGSVRKAGSKLRITAQLIQADSGYHLWSQTYDRELTDVFAIQDEIATAIAEALSAKLELRLAMAVGEKLPEVDPRAYDWYLRGNELILTANQRNRREGVSLLEKAILIEPDFLLARAALVVGLARTTSNYGGGLDGRDFIERAEREIAIVESADTTLPELWRAKSMVAEIRGDWPLALACADRALELRPNYSAVYRGKSRALEKLLRPRERLETIKRWLEVDPLSTRGRFFAVQALAFVDPEQADAMAQSLIKDAPLTGHYAKMFLSYLTERYTDALRHGLLAFAIDPDSYQARQAAWIVLARNGFHEEAGRLTISGRQAYAGLVLSFGRRYQEAEEVLRSALDSDPSDRLVLTNLARSVYAQGRYEEASDLYQGLIVRDDDGLAYAGGGATFPWWGVFAVHAFRESDESDAAEKLAEAFDRYFQELDAMGRAPALVMPWRAALESFNRREDAALATLINAVDLGSSAYELFDSPLFEALNGNMDFEAARARALENYERGRAETRTLMCENNPIPDIWQPLKSTCTVH